MDLPAVLTRLANRRPLLHSEADFQHELAWELRTLGLAGAIRLERPYDLRGRPRIYVDLVADTEGGAVAIELKYWSRAGRADVDGERFVLRNHGAQDVSRYDFWKDVGRLEALVAAGLVARGFAVAVTNDATYWKPGRSATADEQFRLHEGREVAGTLAWGPTAGAGTRRGREEPVALSKPYSVGWRPFSAVEGAGEFRCLVVAVER